MKQKWISLVAFLVAVACVSLSTQVANAQLFGRICPWSSDAPGQVGNYYGCNGVHGCLYGQMVPDGTGGMIRAFGYPLPPCYGNLPCCPDGHGASGRYCPNCPPNTAAKSRPRSSGSSQVANSRSTPSMPPRYTGTQAAYRTSETTDRHTKQTNGNSVQPGRGTVSSPTTIMPMPGPSFEDYPLTETTAPPRPSN